MEDKGSERTSIIFIEEGFLVPTFRYLLSSVVRCFELSKIPFLFSCCDACAFKNSGKVRSFIYATVLHAQPWKNHNNVYMGLGNTWAIAFVKRSSRLATNNSLLLTCIHIDRYIAETPTILGSFSVFVCVFHGWIGKY